jgi:hypothetical protein
MGDCQPTGRMGMFIHVWAGYGSLSSAYCVQAGCVDHESHYPAGCEGSTGAKREADYASPSSLWILRSTSAESHL